MIPIEDQVKILYKLLKKRKFKISHKTIPSYENHKKFVYSNPYRKWFLIKFDESYLGNFYLTYQNIIGINLINYDDNAQLLSILKFIIEKYKPLKEIPSIRNSNFLINTSPSNLELNKKLKKMGYQVIQNTYLILK